MNKKRADNPLFFASLNYKPRGPNSNLLASLLQLVSAVNGSNAVEAVFTSVLLILNAFNWPETLLAKVIHSAFGTPS